MKMRRSAKSGDGFIKKTDRFLITQIILFIYFFKFYVYFMYVSFLF